MRFPPARLGDRLPLPRLVAVCAALAVAGAGAGTLGCSHSSASTSGGGDAGADAGPVAVGLTTRTWVDTSRGTPANGTAPAQSSRTLVTDIWYPTSATGTASSTITDAPLAPGGPYPLVLFVHGSSSNRDTSSFLTVALAQAGYVVAAADFPLTALDTPGGPSDLHVSDQVGDLAFLCDQMAAAAKDSADALHGAVDGESYAVVGHSTGGAVAQLAAFGGDDALITHDPRVAAVVPLSGDACMFNPPFFHTRAVPIFAIGASDDLFVRFANSGQWVFDNTSPPHLLADLVGGQHMYFTNLTFLKDSELDPVPTGPTSPLAETLALYGDAGACLPVPAPGTAPQMAPDTQHALVIQLVTAYLDAEMRHDPAPLAALQAAKNPLVVFQQ
jgi:pimeloyl-ACP methyl ester carboxylesterase